jgi:hypothetical protein
MSSKRQQTMAKMTRERTVKERRALKQEKKDQRKQEAAAAQSEDAAESAFPAPEADEETPSG